MFVAGVVACVAACSKNVSYNTGYVLRPYVQENRAGTIDPLDGVEAFAYALDTTDWTVATYQEALDGVVTAKDDPIEKLHDPAAIATPSDAFPGALGMEISDPRMMIVAVDTKNRIYGYTMQELGFNLPNLTVSMVFHPWKEGFVYGDGRWTMFNEFYEPPVNVDVFIRPEVRKEEGGANEPIASVKAYAYAVDTTEWCVASYADAAAGKITSKTDTTLVLTNPDFTAYREIAGDREGEYKMSVSKPSVMVIVVDISDKIYAYSQQEFEIVKGHEPYTLPLVFEPWRATYLYVDDGWRFVDEDFEKRNPEEPENPENPEEPENPVEPAARTRRQIPLR